MVLKIADHMCVIIKCNVYLISEKFAQIFLDSLVAVFNKFLELPWSYSHHS
jgi:hypothetical protein